MPHPFGDLVGQHLSRKHGFSQNKLANLAGETPSVISEMCHGKRLTGWLARERVVHIIQCLHREDVLTYVEEANALLSAADMTTLSAEILSEAELLNTLKAQVHSAPFLAPSKPAHALVGRADSLRKLKNRLLVRRDMALCAFQGLPGVGKTALAIELAHDRDVCSHFCDGVLWAGLGRTPDVQAILGTWALALGFKSEDIDHCLTVEERQALLKATIGQKHMLVVLDDVWDPDALRAFRVGGSQCAYVITTRHPTIALDCAGDNVVAIEELSPADGVALLDAVAPTAVAIEPEAARGLVSAVGGLPLAIILMGSYLRKASYGVQPRRIRSALQHLRRADERMQLEQPLLDSAHPEVEDVVLSLQSVIAFSDEALTPEARGALYALSIFPAKPNTFSEAAALAVTGKPPAVLDQLMDAGLLEPCGAARYTLHQAIADYAALHLDDLSAVKNMVAFFADYIEEHQHTYAQLDQERENLFAALELALAHGFYAEFVQCINNLFPYLYVRDLYTLSVSFLERAKFLMQDPDGVKRVAVTLRDLEKSLHKQGRYAQAKTRILESLSLSLEYNQAEWLLDLCTCLGDVHADLGEYELAFAHLQKGLALARELGNLAPAMKMLQSLGGIVAGQPARDGAEAHLLEALTLAKRFENYEEMGLILGNLGLVAEKQRAYAQALGYDGEPDKGNGSITSDDMCLLLCNQGIVYAAMGYSDEARVCYRRGLDLSRTLQRPFITILILSNLGELEAAEGRAPAAAQCFEEALYLAQGFENKVGTCVVLTAWGEQCLKQGQLDLAEQSFAEAMQIAREKGIRELLARNLAGLAEMHYARDDVEAALRWARESLRLYEAIHHGEVADVRAWLGDMEGQT